MKYHGNDLDADFHTVVRKILQGRLLRAGERLTVVKAWVFLDYRGEILDELEVELLYRFVGNPRCIEPRAGTYPLAEVL